MIGRFNGLKFQRGVLHPVGFWTPTAGVPFSPTVTGRQLGVWDTDYLVEADASSSEKGPADADASSRIWIEASASNVEIQIDTNANGSSDTNEEWWNEADVGQGVPANGEVIFSLNERSDVTFNIYTVSVDEVTPGLEQVVRAASFTDDDKVTFASMTNGLEYGYNYNAEADSEGPNGSVFGDMRLQITFRKAGFNDFTIEYQVLVSADASNEK